MKRMEMVHAMQMRPVQVLAVQDVKVKPMQVSLVMKRVQVMLVMHVRCREQLTTFQVFE